MKQRLAVLTATLVVAAACVDPHGSFGPAGARLKVAAVDLGAGSGHVQTPGGLREFMLRAMDQQVGDDAPVQPVQAVAVADTFRIDPSHMHIGFAVRHLGIATVRGEFATARGMLIFDAADPLRSTVDVLIDATSMTTRNERRDVDIKTNFLKVESHPEIHFASSRLERAGDGFVAHGHLTMHGVTRSLSLPFTFSGPIHAPGRVIRIGVEGTGAVDRRDYGIELQRMANSALVVGNEVRLTFELEFGRRTESDGS